MGVVFVVAFAQVRSVSGETVIKLGKLYCFGNGGGELRAYHLGTDGLFINPGRCFVKENDLFVILSVSAAGGVSQYTVLTNDGEVVDIRIHPCYGPWEAGL